MQAFIDFLVNNYLWFLIITLILIFALIGYLVDTNEKKKDGISEVKSDLEENVNMNMEMENSSEQNKNNLN